MAAIRQGWIVAIGLAAIAAAPVFADTVLLANGARVTGKVRIGRETVTVVSAAGELTLPSRRVVSIEREERAAVEAKAQAAPPAAAPEQPASTKPAKIEPPVAAVAAPAPPAAAGVSRAPRVREVLADRIDVDFEAVPVLDVLSYVRELTGVNMALAPELRADATPVTLHLKDVRIAEILDLALEPSGLHYTVRPGEVLYVYGGASQEMVMRVYPVADLLVSTEDRWGGDQVSLGGGTGNAGGGSLGGGGGGGGLNPQYQGGRSGARLQAGEQQQAGGRETGYSELGARADALIFLIKNTCGRGTWEDPAGAGVIDVNTNR